MLTTYSIISAHYILHYLCSRILRKRSRIFFDQSSRFFSSTTSFAMNIRWLREKLKSIFVREPCTVLVHVLFFLLEFFRNEVEGIATARSLALAGVGTTLNCFLLPSRANEPELKVEAARKLRSATLQRACPSRLPLTRTSPMSANCFEIIRCDRFSLTSQKDTNS